MRGGARSPVPFTLMLFRKFFWSLEIAGVSNGGTSSGRSRSEKHDGAGGGGGGDGPCGLKHHGALAGFGLSGDQQHPNASHPALSTPAWLQSTREADGAHDGPAWDSATIRAATTQRLMPRKRMAG